MNFMSGPSLSVLRGLPGPDKLHGGLHPTPAHGPRSPISGDPWAFSPTAAVLYDQSPAQPRTLLVWSLICGLALDLSCRYQLAQWSQGCVPPRQPSPDLTLTRRTDSLAWPWTCPTMNWPDEQQSQLKLAQVSLSGTVGLVRPPYCAHLLPPHSLGSPGPRCAMAFHWRTHPDNFRVFLI